MHEGDVAAVDLRDEPALAFGCGEVEQHDGSPWSVPVVLVVDANRVEAHFDKLGCKASTTAAHFNGHELAATARSHLSRAAGKIVAGQAADTAVVIVISVMRLPLQ